MKFTPEDIEEFQRFHPAMWQARSVRDLVSDWREIHADLERLSTYLKRVEEVLEVPDLLDGALKLRAALEEAHQDNAKLFRELMAYRNKDPLRLGGTDGTSM